MRQRSARQLTLDHLTNLPVVIQPSAGQMNSDAGLRPVAELDRRWKFTQLSLRTSPQQTQQQL